MPIIVNGITLPNNGDYIVVNGTKVNKVVANGVTVWEKVTKVTPSNSSIKDYLNFTNFLKFRNPGAIRKI